MIETHEIPVRMLLKPSRPTLREERAPPPGYRVWQVPGAEFVRVVLLVVVIGMVIRLGWQQFG